MAGEIGRQETAADVREKFTEWLKTRKSKKSKTGELDGKTQERYLEYLDGSIEYFKEEYGEYKNVFEIRNPQEFGRIVYAIEDNSGKYPNPNSFRNVHTGAMQYLAFLNGEGEEVGEHDPKLHDGRTRYGGEIFKYVPKKQRNHVQKPGGSGTSGGTSSDGINEEHSQYENQRNLIFFGAPGTGKSYLLNKRSKDLLGEHGDSIRVTFHPDYSYAHFVGTYKPVPEGNEITYKYVPGPFMETYVKAVENPNNRYMLIIEEINRANVAAVFGDVFQLLDRTENGESEYPVKASKDIRDYLEKDVDDNKKTKWDPADCKEIKIPENMYIWATMNSADQGVFPMDTAFKRRWEFEYLPINPDSDKVPDNIKNAMVPMGEDNKMIKWNDVRQDINDLLARLGINEDKQLGFFFINADIIANAAASEDGGKRFKDTFKDKVLMYLFEDAAKHKRKEVFGTNKDNANKRYSEIRKAFNEKGMGVFEGLKKKTDNAKIQTEGARSAGETPIPEGDTGEQEQ